MAKKLNPLDSQHISAAPKEKERKIETQPPKKGGSKKKNTTWLLWRPFVVIVLSLGIVLTTVFFAFNYFKGQYFDPVDENDASPIEVVIPLKSSLSNIADILKENDVIRDKTSFKLYVDFSDMSSQLRAGTYQLSKNMSFDDIIYTLRQGLNTTPTVKLIFKEGFGIEDFGAVLMENGLFNSTDRYKELCRTGEEFAQYTVIAEAIAKNNESEEKRKYVLEGYLFPETYEYYRNASEKDIIQKQLEQFKVIFNDTYYERAEELGMTVDEVITLASIIEKEAKTPDFAKVSAVFHNRLNAEEPMRLDSDATLAYALGVKKYMFTKEEQANPSLYNTRVHFGLPLGPICNPGEAAIRAALYPDEEYEKEGYLYFTLKDVETGELVFTKTYDEHLVEVEKYQHLYEEADRQAAAAKEAQNE